MIVLTLYASEFYDTCMFFFSNNKSWVVWLCEFWVSFRLESLHSFWVMKWFYPTGLLSRNNDQYFLASSQGFCWIFLNFWLRLALGYHVLLWKWSRKVQIQRVIVCHHTVIHHLSQTNILPFPLSHLSNGHHAIFSLLETLQKRNCEDDTVTH